MATVLGWVCRSWVIAKDSEISSAACWTESGLLAQPVMKMNNAPSNKRRCKRQKPHFTPYPPPFVIGDARLKRQAAGWVVYNRCDQLFSLRRGDLGKLLGILGHRGRGSAWGGWGPQAQARFF